MSVIEEIAAERKRQIEVEGWTPEHDDEHHTTEEMAVAAACYALNATWLKHIGERELVKKYWPWDVSWWKPKDPRRDLVRAAALIVAEIERLDRADMDELPRCPKCGYTYKDCQTHMDHHLCGEPEPPRPVFRRGVIAGYVKREGDGWSAFTTLEVYGTYPTLDQAEVTVLERATLERGGA